VEEPNSPPKLSQKDITSIALGVTFSILLLALIAFAAWYFLVRKPRKAIDVESGSAGQGRNWWMVSDSKGPAGEKGTGSLAEWWRKSYAVPDRVEPPPSAGPRSSLQRFRDVLTRKGRTTTTKGSGSGLSNTSTTTAAPAARRGAVTSPTMTLDLPMQTGELHKPRYPSILERGYRVPLYPTPSPPKDLYSTTPSRSLTSPAPHTLVQPLNVAERTLAARRKVSMPPRALKLSNGRPLLPSIAERKTGTPRSPAHRRRQHLIGQFKHPFIPLKDSDTDFPTTTTTKLTISAPMPSTATAETNPKLGYANSTTSSSGTTSATTSTHSRRNPRVTPLIIGKPRGARTSRRVPVPIIIHSPGMRSLMSATPHHLRAEGTKVYAPGMSPSINRPPPTPI